MAYTFQILAQQGSDPTVVTLLMSLESVFSVLAGAIVLHDRLSGREYLGCLLMLVAVVLFLGFVLLLLWLRKGGAKRFEALG